MKKQTIWLLTIVMAVTFGGLLYFQIMYLDNMVGMRDAQFAETVKRSLYNTSTYLERMETLHYLEREASVSEQSFFNYEQLAGLQGGETQYEIEGTDGNVTKYTIGSDADKDRAPKAVEFPSPNDDMSARYKTFQEMIRNQYLYQRGLINEVILSIISESGSRPVVERADSTAIRTYLTEELGSNGINLPFDFEITDEKGVKIYSSPDDYTPKSTYSQLLFPNSDTRYYLNVSFPTKDRYIFSSVRFIIPTLSLTLILLVIFVYIICIAFRQKKITEMKTDFINNMTHEFKTPISTISLAAQMLNDSSVTKSEAMLKHVSQAITDESKRLRFQVDKVLQMSMLDNAQFALRYTEVDANSVIDNVVNTFRLKVEKYGGKIVTHLDAEDAIVNVDQMHFTNVIFNLLDNAVKYKKEDEEPHLTITTTDHNGQLEIKVKDNGVGMRREDIKHIFEKFYRVNTGNLHNVKGFGLGLAYVKKMITEFGGSISVESEPEIGTTFILALPLAQ